MSYKVFYAFVVLILVLSLGRIAQNVTAASLPQPLGTNLIVNGNFEAGNTGFTTGYTYSPGNITSAGVYDVVSDPHNSHVSAFSFGDHTSGHGLMMAINGANSAGHVVWTQTVPVTANTDYEFTAWLASWYFAAPAQLQITINGVSIGTFAAPSTAAVWQQIATTWNSGAHTSASIQIIDLNTTDSGNDFALDDINLIGIPCPSNNLVANGNFGAGNTGFTTGYTYSPGNITSAGVYDVVSDPHNSHVSAFSFGDHTSGSGLMMAVNGANAPGFVVWSQTIPVTANTDYEFTAWLASWYFAAPAQLQLSINGTSLGVFTAPSTAAVWQQIATTWNSGSSTSVSIQIVDLNTIDSGNDFALDDLKFISFGTCAGPTSTFTNTPRNTPITSTPTRGPSRTPTVTSTPAHEATKTIAVSTATRPTKTLVPSPTP